MESPYQFSCTEGCQPTRIVLDRNTAVSWAEKHFEETDHPVRVDAVVGQETFRVDSSQ